MADRMCASITIGGSLRRDKVPEFLQAIRDAGASLEWGDAYFAPETVEELLKALNDGHLQLFDDQAPYGAFPALEETCRNVGLAFSRHAEGKYEYTAELVDFRPGMPEPLVRVSDNNDDDAAYVPERSVREVLALFDAGQTAEAIRKLQGLCPDLPDIPPFEVA